MGVIEEIEAAEDGYVECVSCCYGSYSVADVRQHVREEHDPRYMALQDAQ
jgi:Zn ribbon nucleic-acid-binding protein